MHWIVQEAKQTAGMKPFCNIAEHIPHLPADGTWHEWASDYDIEVSGNTLVIDLPEYEAKVLVL